MSKNGPNYLMKLGLEEKHLKLVMIVNNLELWLSIMEESNLMLIINMICGIKRFLINLVLN